MEFFVNWVLIPAISFGTVIYVFKYLSDKWEKDRELELRVLCEKYNWDYDKKTKEWGIK